MVQTLALPLASWPKHCAELQDLLCIQEVNGMTCHGYARTTKTHTCRNPIARANASRVPELLRKIVSAGKLDGMVKQCLQDLASIVLCRRWHQDQALDKFSTWWEFLSSLVLTSTPQASKPKTVHQTISTARPPPSGQNIPSTSPHRPQSHHRSQRPSNPSTPEHEATTAADTSTAHQSPPSANTRSRTAQNTSTSYRQPPSQEANLAIHTFQPYGQQHTIYYINHDIQLTLKKPLNGRELAVNGCIYGFTYPSHHSVTNETATQYVKIGFSNNVTRRMSDIQRQCHYTPQLLFALDMPHFEWIEKIVHHYLHNSRRREQGCPGCGVRHREWFAVHTDLAKGVVTMWQRWAQAHPYNALGHLSEECSKRLEKLDLCDPRCWIRFVDGVETRNNTRSTSNKNST